MSTVITLIKVQEVVNTGILKATPLSSRFDASLLSPWLDIAEKRFLKTFICDDFYKGKYRKELGEVVVTSDRFEIDNTIGGREFMYLKIEIVSTVIPDFEMIIKRVSFKSIASTLDLISIGSVVSRK